jgi:hypothetical protein
MDHDETSFLSKKIRCTICRAEVTDLNKTYQLPQGFGLVCQKCMAIFSADDLSLIAYLFFIYGGYFGKYNETDFSLTEAVQHISSITSAKKPTSIEDINERLVHKALLHGISPQKFIELLRSISLD